VRAASVRNATATAGHRQPVRSSRTEVPVDLLRSASHSATPPSCRGVQCAASIGPRSAPGCSAAPNSAADVVAPHRHHRIITATHNSRCAGSSASPRSRLTSESPPPPAPERAWCPMGARQTPQL
jgi:hypothetical protein